MLSTVILGCGLGLGYVAGGVALHRSRNPSMDIGSLKNFPPGKNINPGYYWVNRKIEMRKPIKLILNNENYNTIEKEVFGLECISDFSEVGRGSFFSNSNTIAHFGDIIIKLNEDIEISGEEEALLCSHSKSNIFKGNNNEISMYTEDKVFIVSNSKSRKGTPITINELVLDQSKFKSLFIGYWDGKSFVYDEKYPSAKGYTLEECKSSAIDTFEILNCSMIDTYTYIILGITVCYFIWSMYNENR
uniref:Uncharacterized protein n=1 Tax=Pithovirus LCPAC101 TaxID=2506586 RepID=A0A481Z2S1_9VIRU|nr:MAG: hypothetical protein LCPAC101_03010 [Pithovirus LCPAC101]